jgi:hypothetical protein
LEPVQTQAPPLHCWPLGQTSPQPPQLDESVWALMQTEPHFIVPDGQTISQTPFTQYLPDSH